MANRKREDFEEETKHSPQYAQVVHLHNDIVSTKGKRNRISNIPKRDFGTAMISNGLRRTSSRVEFEWLVDSMNQVGRFQKVFTAIGNFYICSIAVGMLAEIMVMYPAQHRTYRDGIDSLLVLLIEGIPIAMPTGKQTQVSSI